MLLSGPTVPVGLTLVLLVYFLLRRFFSGATTARPSSQFVGIELLFIKSLSKIHYGFYEVLSFNS